MDWLADECVDASLVRALRLRGYNVLYAAELTPQTPDEVLVARALAEQRLLLTFDKDFGDLVIRRRLRVPGLVLLRIHPARYEQKETRLLAAVDRFGASLMGRYTVIQEGRLRTRSI